MLSVVGEDWDELERKAAKCELLPFHPSLCNLFNAPADQKRVEGATGRGGDSDSDNSDKPKKKSTNGKTKQTKSKR